MQNEVIEKLQKILELATRGATQGEMEAAMGRAKEIALKHGIELASIPPRQDSKVRTAMTIDTHKGLKTSTRYVHPYHNWVFNTLQDVFGVHFIIWRTRLGTHPYITQMYVVGEQADVVLAVGLFPWLESLFPSLYHKAMSEGILPKNFAAQNGFYLGLYRGIVEANKREEAKLSTEDRSKWALVVQDKSALISVEVAQYYAKPDPKKKEKKAKGRGKDYDWAAANYGKEKGRGIRLGQLNGTSESDLVA